jgi:GMP synthase-like glutamine amidotransferase
MVVPSCADGPGRETQSMTSCLVIQHVLPEKPYKIAEALGRAGVDVVICQTFSGDTPPGPDRFEGIVVMGGPMSAASDEGFPSRKAEVALLTEALERRIPTLGVCLGAQLLAVAGGGEVTNGVAGPEIGWGTVQLSGAAASDPLLSGLPRDLGVLHWHGDTYGLPQGAVNLASNATYSQQAFRCGPRAWGLQFHVEIDGEAVEAFLNAFGADAFAAKTTPDAIRAGTPAALASLRPCQSRILDRFASLVASNGADSDPTELPGELIEHS